MSACCDSARGPEVRLVGDPSDLPVAACPKPPSSATQASAKLLDGPLSSVQLSPFKDLRSQLTDLRHRQEELFRQLMEQQSRIQSQMLGMHSASELMGQRQEDLVSEFREFSSKSRVADIVKDVIKTLEDVNIAKDVVTPTGKELLETPSRTRMVDIVRGDFKTNEDENEEDTEVVQAGCDSIESAFFMKEPAQPEPVVDPTPPSTPAHPLASCGKQSTRSLDSANARKKAKSVLTFGIQHVASDGHDRSLRHRVDKLLKTQHFEFGIAFAIMVNAFIMCWESQYAGLDVGFQLEFPGRAAEARVVWAGAETAFTFFDWLFGFLFLLEMSIKLIAWGCKYFYDSDDWYLQDFDSSKRPCYRKCLWSVQGWNILDFICVLAFVFDKVVALSNKVAAAGSVNPQMLRVLRLFRLFRLVRLLRVLEAVDHLYIMTTAISGLRQVLTWAIILLFIMLLTCDLFLVQILHATYFNQVTARDLNEEQLRKHHQMYEYFGTCTRCMLSMFEITLGNWPPVARLLSEEVSEWFTLFCLAHKLTIGFAVIGVITGVILQETFKVAQTDDVIMFKNKKTASATLRKKMKNLFEALDQEGDGRLEEAEFTAIGELPDMKCWLASLDIETDDLNTLFSLIDVEGNGYITLDELVARIPRIKGNARGIDMLCMRRQLQTEAK